MLAEVESTCDRIGLVRGGRIVTTGTIEDLKRDATRASRDVLFARRSPPPGVRRSPEVTRAHAASTEWMLDVRGPLGPLVGALAGLPVHDLVVDPFRLEDYISQFYGGEAR